MYVEEELRGLFSHHLGRGVKGRILGALLTSDLELTLPATCSCCCPNRSCSPGGEFSGPRLQSYTKEVGAEGRVWP